jgi:hypothetical protein
MKRLITGRCGSCAVCLHDTDQSSRPSAASFVALIADRDSVGERGIPGAGRKIIPDYQSCIIGRRVASQMTNEVLRPKMQLRKVIRQS